MSTPLLASSIDSATPLAPWASSGGGAPSANIVVGRNGNGIQPTVPNDATKCFAQLATPSFTVAGVAIKFNDFNQNFLQLSSEAASDNTVVNIVFVPVPDGRLIVRMTSAVGTDQKIATSLTGTGLGYVREFGYFAYFEVSTAISMTVTPVSPSTSGVSVFGTITLTVNNFQVWSGSLSTSAVLPNGSIPAPGTTGAVLFRRFSICSSLCVYDDVYLDTTLFGDVLANPDDLTITAFATTPTQTQIIQEVMGLQPVDPVFTQVVREVYGKLGPPLGAYIVGKGRVALG